MLLTQTHLILQVMEAEGCVVREAQLASFPLICLNHHHTQFSLSPHMPSLSLSLPLNTFYYNHTYHLAYYTISVSPALPPPLQPLPSPPTMRWYSPTFGYGS